MSRTVWGFLSDTEGPLAAYYLQWTLGRIDHGANIDFVVGQWGEGTSPQDRAVVSVQFRSTADGPQFMVIDSDRRPAAKVDTLACRALRRDQVIGTPLAAEVFAMLDAIWAQEGRIGELKLSAG
jgi:hypothetical protein